MCKACDEKTERIKSYFSSVEKLEELIDRLRYSVIQKSVENIFEGREPNVDGECVALFHGIDTIKGFKDVELIVDLELVKSGNKGAGFSVYLDNVVFHDVGTLTNESIDNIAVCKENGNHFYEFQHQE